MKLKNYNLLRFINYFNYKIIYNFFTNRWYINYFYNRFIAKSLLIFGYNITFLIMDQGFINNGIGQLYIIKLVRSYLEIVLNLYKLKY